MAAGSMLADGDAVAALLNCITVISFLWLLFYLFKAIFEIKIKCAGKK